jgi:hypothetical protein
MMIKRVQKEFTCKTRELESIIEKQQQMIELFGHIKLLGNRKINLELI